jgi:hypothetical protein
MLMTTGDLGARGFHGWSKFNRPSKSEVLKSLPCKFGVYVLRGTTAIGRIPGASDIAYIGSACNQRGLQGRIRQYFSPGPSQLTNRRIIGIIGDSAEYEIGWCEVTAKSEAVALEQFFEQHGERPPLSLKG